MHWRLLVAGSCLGLLGLNIFATRWAFSARLVLWAFLAGLAVAVLAYIAAVIFINDIDDYRNSDRGPLHSLKPLAFTSPEKWAKEVEASGVEDSYHRTPIYPQSFVVSEALDLQLDHFCKNFVSSWYNKVSSDPSFTWRVDKLIRYAAGELHQRLGELDAVEVIVGKIVPLLTAHLNSFSVAEKVVRGKHLSINLTESEELDLAIAGKFNDGKLHPAASIVYSDTQLAQKDHLRKIVEKFTGYIIPKNEQKSRVVSSIIREILACAVLFPIMSALSDPDTWNQLIVAIGKPTLQDRKTVRKLRAALDQHAMPPPGQHVLSPSSSKYHSNNSTGGHQFIMLSPNDDERTFERFIRSIRQCNNLSDARRLRSHITAQLKREARIEGQNGWAVYIKRLETGKRLIDERVAQLSTGKALHSTGLSKLIPKSSGLGGDTTPSKLEFASLEDILRDTSGLSYFMEHMDRVKRLPLVQFWLVVDGLRTPLEGDVNSSDEDDDTPDTSYPPWTTSDRNDLAQIHDAYISIPELHFSEKSRRLVKDFLKAGSNATQHQYAQARWAILRAQTVVYEEMQKRDLPEFKTTDLYYKFLATDEAAALSNETRPPSIMGNDRSLVLDGLVVEPDSRDELASARGSMDSKRDWQQYDPLMGQPIIAEEVPFISSSSGGGKLAVPPVKTPEERRGTPESGIVEAVEAALNDIIEERPNELEDSQTLVRPSGVDDTSPRSSLDMARSISWRSTEERSGPSTVEGGATKAQAKRKPASIASLGLADLRGSFFADEDELFPDDTAAAAQFDSEGDDGASDGSPVEQADDNEIHEAAPGDLGLSEAISALNYDIKKLLTQEAVIDSLYRKAELTNNTVELRILKKSKSSLQREIRRKELQRQQYIVQESDNSLFGRSTVGISSTMVGKGDGQEYALYIVEVHRNGGEHLPAAQWAVARRYSEFFQLHQQLKRFPSVRALEFPRRRVVMKLQKDFLEKRRIALERYLQSLLRIPEVCSREFRAFLSQRNIESRHSPQPGNNDAMTDRNDLVSRLYNSIADGMEDVLGNLPILDHLSLASANILAAATGQPSNPQNIATPGVDPHQILEAEAELSAYEDKETSEPLVKPICDLFLEVFELNRKSNWFRGRAVVVVLHQLLGGTIERKMRDLAKGLLDEDSFLGYLGKVEEVLWPGGVLKQERPVRTAKEKSKTRTEARVMLDSLIPDISANVVGRANAKAASRRLSAVMNNHRLNTSLVYTLLDELVAIIFRDV